MNQVPLSRFLLALAIACLPAIWLERTNERWAWRYVVVVLLGVGVMNAVGLTRLANFVVGELGGKRV